MAPSARVFSRCCRLTGGGRLPSPETTARPPPGSRPVEDPTDPTDSLGSRMPEPPPWEHDDMEHPTALDRARSDVDVCHSRVLLRKCATRLDRGHRPGLDARGRRTCAVAPIRAAPAEPRADAASGSPHVTWFDTAPQIGAAMATRARDRAAGRTWKRAAPGRAARGYRGPTPSSVWGLPWSR